MVMGGNSCSRGRGFESHRCILNGYFFTLIGCKNCIVCLKKTKRGWEWPIFKKHALHLRTYSDLDSVDAVQLTDLSPPKTVWTSSIPLFGNF